jgi:hypothetical protein
MRSCATCNNSNCVDYGSSRKPCDAHDLEYKYEAYTFNEVTGSEHISLFLTAEARDKFVARQPSHMMAH